MEQTRARKDYGLCTQTHITGRSTRMICTVGKVQGARGNKTNARRTAKAVCILYHSPQTRSAGSILTWRNLFFFISCVNMLFFFSSPEVRVYSFLWRVFRTDELGWEEKKRGGGGNSFRLPPTPLSENVSSFHRYS